MEIASSRRGTVLLICLGLILFVVACTAIFCSQEVEVDAYQSRGDALKGIQPPMSSGEINVNTSDSETLMLLPGVGEITAMNIINERETNGLFHYPEDLLAVKGIGDKKLEGMLPHIRLDEQP